MHLRITFACILLFAALFNAVCWYNACIYLLLFFALHFYVFIIYTNAFCFHPLSLSYWHI